MKDIIRVKEWKGKTVVSAKDLYSFLGLNKTHWSRWCKKNIVENSFALESTDYEGYAIMANGNETMEFALSLDFAKRLAMMARTEQGEKARRYFLECEEKLIKAKLGIGDLAYKVEVLQEKLELRDKEFGKLYSAHQRLNQRLIAKVWANTGLMDHQSIRGFRDRNGIPVKYAGRLGILIREEMRLQRKEPILSISYDHAPVDTFPYFILKKCWNKLKDIERRRNKGADMIEITRVC